MLTLQDKEDSLMKLNSKRIDFEYTPSEEIFTFSEDTGLDNGSERDSQSRNCQTT